MRAERAEAYRLGKKTPTGPTNLGAYLRRALAGARSRAISKGIPFNLTIEHLAEIWTGMCPALGIQIVSGGHLANSAHLDRFIPSLGYVKGNVAFISALANRIKQDADAETVQKVAAWMQSRVDLLSQGSSVRSDGIPE